MSSTVVTLRCECMNRGDNIVWRNVLHERKAIEMLENGIEYIVIDCGEFMVLDNDIRLTRVLENNTSCKGLKLCENELKPRHMIYFSRMLRINQTLMYLHISENEFRDEGALELANGLLENNILEVLQLPKNIIGATGIAAITQAMIGKVKLRVLDFSRNRVAGRNITDIQTITAMGGLRDCILNCTSLSCLKLQNLLINGVMILPICIALESNVALSCLNLDGNQISEDGASSLVTALRVNTTLTSLLLSKTQLGPVGASAIVEAIHENENSVLEILDLSFNNIVLVDSILPLRDFKFLHVLNLHGNNIASGDSNGLEEIFSQNQTITELILSNNDFNVLNAHALANAIEQNSTLLKLRLSYCKLGENLDVLEPLCISLGKNKSLETLALDSNKIGQQGFEILVQGLVSNTSLRNLSLKMNNIDANGAKLFAPLLYKYETINLNHNKLENDGGISFLTNLQNNKGTLQTIHLNFTSIDESIITEINTIL